MRQFSEVICRHLDRMSDSTGLIQHAIYDLPRRESGYTTDDNARALRLCARLWRQRPDEAALERTTKFLSFVQHAYCPGRGFHNFMAYDRRWLDPVGCGDCQGQAVRALAEVVGSRLPDGHRDLARELIDDVQTTLADLRSLRAQAYVILAWGHLWREGGPGWESFEAIAWSAAQRLVESYHRSRRPNWQWFEPRLTYANAALPHALFVAAQRWPTEEFLGIAEASFNFLDHVTTIDQVFWPIGNHRWYSLGDSRSTYDQQPIEAAMMAEAALAAFAALNDQKYLATFGRAQDWFHGRNSLGTLVVDLERGACFDGLQPTGVNRNQGAESLLAHLWTELLGIEVRRSLFASRAVAAVNA